jgi:ABC-type Co2+ transport system permease subunit
MRSTRKLFVSVAETSVLYTFLSWALLFVKWPEGSFPGVFVVLLLAVLLPDGLAAWWVFRKVRRYRSRKDSLRAAAAFAVSAPLVLAVGNLLSELIGGYAELLFGGRFVLPIVAAFLVVLMIFVPTSVVMWSLHPSAGVGAGVENRSI